MSAVPIETFPALDEIPFCRHAFMGRVPDLDLELDRSRALPKLAGHHHSARADLGLGDLALATAEQVHGNVVQVASATSRAHGADGLITNDPGLCLGIYVADCCAVYLIDVQRRCLGLVHSGRKGTELGIVPAAVDAMRIAYGSSPADIVAQLSPCIRPPHYEVDLPAAIFRQCQAVGLRAVYDCGTCTACHLDRYYSYRAELGRTGRMLALLALR